MKIYNSLTRKKQEFTPLKKDAKEIGMYVCGPTVYDAGHLGHARSAVSFDLIRRYFLYKGFKVNFVSNITDVDDKIIKRAAELKISEPELAARIIPEYEKDYAALNVLPATHAPRATQYIPQMVALIADLIKKGYAYKTEDGIYFEVKKFKKYGKLSNKRLDELQMGSRVAIDEKKRSPEDFALWKAEKPGEPSFPGPAGLKGRPGWHIECSAMSMKLLGETFDIHGGGIDLIFPHHEDEIAQSEAVTDRQFARFWMHNGHIQINKEKMSKSLGNFFTIKKILAKYNPAVVRYFLLAQHYRMPIEFSDNLLEQAKSGLGRLHDFARRLESKAAPEGPQGAAALSIKKAIMKFEKAMDDDFDAPHALAAIFDFVRELNALMDKEALTSVDRECALKTVQNFNNVLGVFKIEGGAIDEDIKKMIEERNEAREKKNFAKSDEIRDSLKKRGIELEDTPKGTTWKRAL